MTDVAAGPGGYVAVGCRTLTAATSTNCLSDAWRSADARTWTRVALPMAAMIDGIVGMQIVGDDSGYVAWGGLVDPVGRVGFWFSTDGTVWRAAPPVAAFAGAGIGSVVRYRGEWLAAGGAGERGAVVFASPDGIGWQLLPFIGQRTWSLDVVVSTAGGLTGFGLTGDEDPLTSATYRSTEGRHWQASIDLPAGAHVAAAVAAPDRLVTLGWLDSANPPPALAGWTSKDGAAWATAACSPPGGSCGGMLAYGGGAFFMLRGGDEPPIGHWSADGIRWLETPSVPDAKADGTERATGCTGGPCQQRIPRTQVRNLAGIPDGFIAVGTTHLANGDYRAVVWIAAPAGDGASTSRP